MSDSLIPDATIAHIGVAVPDADAASRFYREVLGLTPRPIEHADGAKIVSFDLGPSDVEFLEPVDPASPVAKFLQQRGAGIHHVCLRVPDLDAALAKARAAGFQLVDETPRDGAHGKRIAFLHPKSTGGVLVELTS